MNFAQFLAAYDDLVARARANKLTVADFEGTTISLTNPGTVGTMGSIPRLMPGQGAIIATGAIDYPPEYRGVPEDVRASLGLSKVMTVTCTYDHRVIQGAESGVFLGRIQALLEGEDGFYEDDFHATWASRRAPVRWEPDQAAAPLVNADPVKQAAVARLIQAWRERGHLIADIDPLGVHASLASGSGAVGARPDHLGSGPHVSRGLVRRDYAAQLLVDRLRSIYAGNMGVQYMHIDDPEERDWLRAAHGDLANQWTSMPRRASASLEDIIEAEGFETVPRQPVQGPQALFSRRRRDR